MAQRRMISHQSINDDNFADMGQGARLLYVYLVANADDDGMIRQIKNMCVLAGATEEDLAVLIQKGYVYRFPTGTVVIMDWTVHNKIPPSRYTPTLFREEYACLEIDPKGRYIVREHPVYTQGREAEAGAVHLSVGEGSEGCADAEPAGVPKKNEALVAPSSCPYEAIVEAFREDCPSYTAPRVISEKQRQKLDVLWSKFPSLEDVRSVFVKAEQSEFLRNGFKGKCTFDWIVTLENADKINMGNYSSSSQGNSGSSFDTDDFFGAAIRRSMGDEVADQFRRDKEHK